MNPQPVTLGQIFQNAANQLQEAIRDGLKKRIAEDLDARARAAGCTIRPHRPIVYAAGIDGGGSPQVDGWYWACPDCDEELMCTEYMCICRGLCMHRKSHVHGYIFGTREQALQYANEHAKTQWILTELDEKKDTTHEL